MGDEKEIPLDIQAMIGPTVTRDLLLELFYLLVDKKLVTKDEIKNLIQGTAKKVSGTVTYSETEADVKAAMMDDLNYTLEVFDKTT